MQLRRLGSVVLLWFVAALLPMTVVPTVEAQSTAGCAALERYASQMMTTGELIDAQEADGPDMNAMETWTDADYDQVIGNYDTFLETLGDIVPPEIANHFHNTFIATVTLLREMLVTAQSAGPLALIAFLEPIDSLNQQLATEALALETACNLAMFDHDEDGVLEVGVGAGTPESGWSEFSPTPAASTQAEPVPAGSTAMLDSQWELTVLSVTPDATAEVLAFEPSNTPPAQGSQYLIVRVRITNTGTDDNSFNSWRLSLQDASGQTYAPFIDSCGFTPQELTIDTIAPGESAEGNVCWAVSSEATATGSLVMFDGDQLEADRVYFSLDGPEGAADPGSPGGFADAVEQAGEDTVSGFGTPERDDEE